MKTVKLFFGSIFFFLFALNVNAQTTAKNTGVKTQESTMISTSNSIELKGSSDIREIQVEVTEDGCDFNMDVSGEIRKGSIKVEIIDPKGKKRGIFSTGTITENKPNNTEKSNYEERVNGRIMQNNASSGIWIVKIIPINAFGIVNFRNQQSSNTNK